MSLKIPALPVAYAAQMDSFVDFVMGYLYGHLGGGNINVTRMAVIGGDSHRRGSCIPYGSSKKPN